MLLSLFLVFFNSLTCLPTSVPYNLSQLLSAVQSAKSEFAGSDHFLLLTSCPALSEFPDDPVDRLQGVIGSGGYFVLQ